MVAVTAEEPVLLGSAILGAVAGRAFPDLAAAMAAMSSPARTYAPADGPIRALHAVRFAAFGRLQAVAREIGAAGDPDLRRDRSVENAADGGATALARRPYCLFGTVEIVTGLNEFASYRLVPGGAVASAK